MLGVWAGIRTDVVSRCLEFELPYESDPQPLGYVVLRGTSRLNTVQH